eukprot:CAMPEP_0201929266 /NCGR_PEP_ID=MMETSP0903-20130614/22623_1 /ASSEMBLY_ACC=CAM_ASM_000552 /TAXON_ID=420261 /ORGANISM="Thalassiosira antarctica, Strain CCMP982" /LENGTH=1108 /DNA_ID=CAMNT_0048467989 /DNA_START=71 /DNA_END=3394 /DNA_ORIENTATION=-
MALRAFQSNPSIGGFGGESLFSRLQGPIQFASSQSRIGDKHPNAAGRRGAGAASRTARPSSQDDIDPAKNSGGQFAAGSCDAFAQIVKELVDNAVDACVHAEKKISDGNENTEQEEKIMKRVRVTMTSVEVEVPGRPNTNDEDPATSVTENIETMECLRIDISDNGCGMENIDDCVTAFRSNKNGATKQGDNFRNSKKTGEKSEEATKCNAKKKKGSKKQKSSQKQTPSDSNENYTSGRYGVGLTLCLLHAQRLCPGTGACITSATASADEWTRAVYEPDTGVDDIVCKKKENFPKEIEGESGTTISILVPGGEDARRAWPRLAEYFARFQLSIDLPCSLEVKAPTLQSMPLYIRPPSEIERRINRKRNVSLAAASLMDGSDANSDSNKNSNRGNWDGGDGFDEGNSPEADTNRQEPKTSKAARQRAEVELQKKKKISLICKAASAYKGRPGLKVDNVAYTTQPIRRNTGSGQSAASKNGPVLEIGLIVFGPEPDDDNDGDGIEHESFPQSLSNNNHNNGKSSATLQVVRMVNGIPLLDSSEALACGVVQKIASNVATWNSFGLTVLQNSKNDLDPVPLDERNTPTFEINDSAQVAPFLKSSTHSLFQGQSQDNGQSSSDDDDFDIENVRGKRKKERQFRCILPAQQRLGDVLMVVQIRAKPSALPLPTLSKGRLPLNDKGISDALENGISDCLRCLQRSSPGLLLTAQQLKRVDRDVKYVPAAGGAIASVLCRSKQRGVYDNAMNIASGWDDEVKKILSCSGNEHETVQRRGRVRSTVAERSNNPMNIQLEKLRVDTLRPILERRLRFVISDEFKDAKKAEEKDKQRREREEIAAAKKRAKKSKTVESDGMKNDCFESDGDGSSGHSSAIMSARDRSPFDSDTSSPVVHTRHRRKRGGSVSSSEQLGLRRNSSPQKSSRDDFDSDMSSPVVHTRRRHWSGSSVDSKHPSDRGSQGGSKKSSCYDFDSDMSSPVVHTGRHRWKQNPAGSSDGPRRDRSPQKSPFDNFDNDTSSPVAYTRRHHRKGKSDDEFDDGYESSPRLSNGRLGNERSASSDRFRRGSHSNVGFQSDGSRLSAHSPDESARRHDDAMSSESEWSSQYGEVVPGHL